MATTVYSVTGMTCDHCVNAVKKEVTKVAGVTDVSVDLENGQASVTGDAFTDAQIIAAIDEAGFSATAK